MAEALVVLICLDPDASPAGKATDAARWSGAAVGFPAPSSHLGSGHSIAMAMLGVKVQDPRSPWRTNELLRANAPTFDFGSQNRCFAAFVLPVLLFFRADRVPAVGTKLPIRLETTNLIAQGPNVIG